MVVARISHGMHLHHINKFTFWATETSSSISSTYQNSKCDVVQVNSKRFADATVFTLPEPELKKIK